MKLKELRKQNNKTQEEVAKFLNIAQRTYSGYEISTSEPTIDTLCKLADYYGVSLDYLVGRDFNNSVGFLTENQKTFVNSFLALNSDNQQSAVIYVCNLLANQI